MNIGGGDEYDERARTGEGVPGPYGPEPGRRTGTRTRLPGSEGTGRPPARPGRSMVTVVAVIVLLIAAIAFANQSGGGGDDGGGDKGGGGDGPKAQPTAPSGDKPVKSASGAVPSGFAHSKNGAQSAAANYAVALGGDGMFNRDRRHEIVKALADPGSVDKLRSGIDAGYGKKLNKSIGLDADGKPPSGATFVNRTVPAGTDIQDYSSDRATPPPRPDHRNVPPHTYRPRRVFDGQPRPLAIRQPGPTPRGSTNRDPQHPATRADPRRVGAPRRPATSHGTPREPR